MDSLVNYKFKDFLTIDPKVAEEYIDFLAYLKPKETAQQVFYMTLGEVQDIRDLMQQGRLDDLKEIVKKVQKLNEDEIGQMRIVDFFGLSRSIKDQIEEIARAERTSLTGKAYNQKWEAVNGAEKLAKFGIYNVLDKLAKGDIFKYEKALKLIYADVFTKLYRDTVIDDLEYEMSKMKTLTQ